MIPESRNCPREMKFESHSGVYKTSRSLMASCGSEIVRFLFQVHLVVGVDISTSRDIWTFPGLKGSGSELSSLFSAAI